MELCEKYEIENETSNPVLEIIKKCVRTKLFLFATIAFTVAVILNFVNGFVDSELLGLDFSGVLFIDVFSRLGININFFPYDLIGLMLRVVFEDIFSIIPSLLIAIGMWNTYFSLQGKSDFSEKMVGIKIIRVMMIIFMVLVCWSLITCVVNIVTIALFFGIGDSATDALSTVFVEILGSVFGVLVLYFVSTIIVIVYFFLMFKFVGWIKQIVKTGAVNKKISLFMPVATIAFGGISALLTLYGAYNELISSFGYFGDACLIILINLISALSTILFGTILLSFRRMINDLA